MFKSRLEKKKREAEEKPKVACNRIGTVKENSETLSVSTSMNGNIMAADGRDGRDDSRSSSNKCSHSLQESEKEMLTDSVCDQGKTNSSNDVGGNFKEQTEKDEVISWTSSEVQGDDSVIDRNVVS